MRHGNWIPISKALSKYMPQDRPYTELEAAYSLQLDYDNKASVTVAGYAAIWGWSRGRVLRFLDSMNVVIQYPENTNNKRNQRGHIVIHKADIKRAYNGHIRLIENNTLEEQKDIKRTYNGHKADISQYTTIEPSNLEPNKTTKAPPKKGGNGNSKKGSRIPDDFSLTEDMQTWFNEQEFKNISAKRSFDEFIDYWKGVSGQKGVKSDWLATWRNGMRKAEKWAAKDGGRDDSWRLKED